MVQLREVEVEVFGRPYRVSVAAGNEAVIQALAKEFSAEVFRMSKQLGSITDPAFLYLLVGLLQLHETKRCKEKLEQTELTNESQQKEMAALRKQTQTPPTVRPAVDTISKTRFEALLQSMRQAVKED